MRGKSLRATQADLVGHVRSRLGSASFSNDNKALSDLRADRIRLFRPPAASATARVPRQANLDLAGADAIAGRVMNVVVRGQKENVYSRPRPDPLVAGWSSSRPMNFFAVAVGNSASIPGTSPGPAGRNR